MSLELVADRYSRLKQELACAYGARPWQSSRIDRIADQLVAVERELISTFGSAGLSDAARRPEVSAPATDRGAQGRSDVSCAL